MCLDIMNKNIESNDENRQFEDLEISYLNILRIDKSEMMVKYHNCSLFDTINEHSK